MGSDFGTMSRPAGRSLSETYSKANEGLSSAQDPVSRLGYEAVTGRIVHPDSIQGAVRAGWNIWKADFNERQRRHAERRRSDPFMRPLTPYAYRDALAKLFVETAPSGLATTIDGEAKHRAYLIFTGGWAEGKSLVGRAQPFVGLSEYAIIDPETVARATLYLPYLAARDMQYDRSVHLTKATSPLVAVDEELFFGENNGAIHHNELLFDPRLDVRGYYADKDHRIQLRQLESRHLEFEPGQAEPATIAKFLGCCVYIRPPAYGGQLARFLGSIRFDASQLRIALMVHDSASRAYLASDSVLSAHGRAEAIDRGAKDLEPWLLSQIQKASGRALLLLSHVEGKDYVVRDASGHETGRIAIRRANELALQHRVTLFNLGCRTAATLHEYDGIGVYDAFNSIHMLRTISRALHAGPNTIAGFLERLGTPEARIVIPASIMKNAESLAALRGLRDQAGEDVAKGKRMRVPAIEPIVSPSGMTDRIPTSMSVFLASARQNQRGFYPVIAELQVVMPVCAALAAAKKLAWEERKTLTCEQFQRASHVPVVTHLYGDARSLR